MASYETLEIEDRGRARIVRINRPKALNALNSTVIAELSRVLEELGEQIEANSRRAGPGARSEAEGVGARAGEAEHDPSPGRPRETNWGVRALILTGAGDKAFVAGADIAAMVDMSKDQALEFASRGHAVGEMLANLAVPAIAAVNGFALGGGCELALACDFIIASDKAKFGQPEVKLGVIPGFGGTQRMIRRVGIARALELCMTGEIIRPDEALRIGLVNRVVASDQLLDTCLTMVDGIAKMGPLAVAAAKRVIHQGAELPLAAANLLEVEGFAGLFETRDQTEGMRAFLDKRDAQFTGE